MSVKGIERVKSNAGKFIIDAAGKKTEAAIYAVLSQGAAISQLMTPMDTGNLAASQYAPDINRKAGKVMGTVGYTADYAAYVHNAPGTLKGLPRANGNGNYWDPDAEPQFLTKGFEELKPSIPAILKEVYRV